MAVVVDRTRWTLCRDDAGLYLLYDEDKDPTRLDTAGLLHTAAWGLGMPGPATEADVLRALANPERTEAEAISFLQERIGARGPRL